MGVLIPKYETENKADTTDTVAVPTHDEYNALVDRVNAIAAQVGGGVGGLAALGHTDPTSRDT